MWTLIRQSTNAAAGRNRPGRVLAVSMHGLGAGGGCVEEQEEATGADAMVSCILFAPNCRVVCMNSS